MRGISAAFVIAFAGATLFSPVAATVPGAPAKTSAVQTPGPGPVIQIEDVALFYKVYDAAGGHG